MADTIKISGLKEFNKSLKQIDKDLPKAVRLALNEAGDVIVDYAKPRVPKKSGRAARSVKAKSTRTAVRVAGGGKRAPYYPWLDFGGAVGPDRSVKRPFLEHGRYIYRGYFLNKDRIVEVAQTELVKVAEQAGFEVT